MGAPSPSFGDGAVVRGIASTTGVALTNTPQTLAVVELENFVAGSYKINLNAAGLSTVSRTVAGANESLAFNVSDPDSTFFTVTAVPEPSSFLCLGLIAVGLGFRNWKRQRLS